MVGERGEHTTLSTLLAALYPETARVSRFADEIGLGRQNVDRSGAALDAWSNLLHAAGGRGLVEAIVTSASAEFPARAADLEAAAARFQPELYASLERDTILRSGMSPLP